MLNLTKQFMQLFRGNTKYYKLRQYDPETYFFKAIENKEHALAAFEEHLSGDTGLCIVPNLENNVTCYFGVIIVDKPNAQLDINLISLEREVRKMDLPLIVCRSKSGGAHLYLFGAEPLIIYEVNRLLAHWAKILRVGKRDIFPSPENWRWIDLCYFDQTKRDQLRYCIERGEQLTLHQFIISAESKKITDKDITEHLKRYSDVEI